MICPNCAKDLRYRERGSGTCPACKRAFALEPKENPLRLHDIRMRKLIEKLGNGEGLRYTPTQLWYAAARGRTPTSGTSHGCVAFGLFVPTVIASWVIIGVSEFDPDVTRTTVVLAVAFMVLVVLLAVRAARRAKRTGLVNVPMPLDGFRSSVIKRWTSVYSRPPAGLTDEGRVRLPVRPDGGTPKLVLLCPDRAVLACLALNDAHTTHSLALVQSPDQLGSISSGRTPAAGAGVVGIVLHDASPEGLAFASASRTALGGRVVVAGMLPRSVMDKERAVVLRKPLLPRDLDALRESSSALTAREADWLSRGWWSPLAAVPPAKLLTVVARAVERAEGIADPDRGRARQVGFLTWPTASCVMSDTGYVREGRMAGSEESGTAAVETGGAVRRAILDRVLRTAVERAGAPGQLRFTERQLYYEVCRVLIPWHRASRRTQFTSAPAVTYDAYRAALRRLGPEAVDGLLPPVVAGPRREAGRHTPEPDLFDYGLPRLLVCESDDIAAMLRANGVPMESACPVFGASELPLDPGVLGMLALAERATVYLLHDASAYGLTFPARFARTADIPFGVRVVPLGLRPRQAGALHLVHGRGPAYAAVPAHVPGLGSQLGRWERDWLRRGKFVELAAVNPASLVRTVHRLVREVRQPRSQLTELRQVRRAGFLSWPTA